MEVSQLSIQANKLLETTLDQIVLARVCKDNRKVLLYN